MFNIARTIHTQRIRAMNASWRVLAASVFSIALIAPGSGHAAPKPQQLKIKPPPSAELTYTIAAQQSGLNVKGDAVLKWTLSGKSYSIDSETNAAMFGTILQTRSEGRIETTGLSPTRFTEKRYRKKEAETLFDHAGRTITLSGATEKQPLQEGVQDRSSVVWQLISIARGNPNRLHPGSEWSFQVTGRRDIDPWTFRVIKKETIPTPLGVMEALHLKKIDDEHRDQEVDLWLAPSLQWYPVKLRFVERGGSTIEQTLKSVK